MFIVFEGIDGAGKSTQVELLAEHLRGQGRTVITAEDPIGTPVGDAVAEILGEHDMEPLTELILTNAARAELTNDVIKAALQAGAVVIAERFADTSVVYQGMAGSLGAAKTYEVNTAATGGFGPQRTFVLLLSPDEARERRGGEPELRDRGGEFMGKVAHAYEMLAISGRQYVRLDATESIEEIAREVRDRIRLYELEVKKALEAEANDPFGAIAGMGGMAPGADFPDMPSGPFE